MEINGETIPHYDHRGPEWEKAMLELDKKAIIQILKTKGEEADRLDSIVQTKIGEKMVLSKHEEEVIKHLINAWNAFVGLRVIEQDDADEFRRAIHLAQMLVMSRPVRIKNAPHSQAPTGEVKASEHQSQMPSECSTCGDFFVPKSEKDTKCAECRRQEAEEAHDDGECIENCPVCAEERGEEEDGNL